MKKKEFGIRELPPGSVLLMGDGRCSASKWGLPAARLKIQRAAWRCARGPAKDPLKTHRAAFDGEVGGVDVPLALTVRSE